MSNSTDPETGTSATALPLPAGWPDGPTDEILGELLQAAFVARSPADSFVDDTASPACTRLNGTFDLRRIGIAIAPAMRDLIGRHLDLVIRQRDEARARITELEAKVEHWTERAALAGQGLGRHVAEQEARIAELEAERPRFSHRQFVQALRDRDEAQSRAAELAERIAELESGASEHAQVIEYLHHAHGIEIDHEHEEFQEWKEQYGA